MRAILIDPDLKCITEVDCVDFRDVTRRIRGWRADEGQIVRVGISEREDLIYAEKQMGHVFSLDGLNVIGNALILETEGNGTWTDTTRGLVDIQTKIQFLGKLSRDS